MLHFIVRTEPSHLVFIITCELGGKVLTSLLDSPLFGWSGPHGPVVLYFVALL